MAVQLLWAVIQTHLQTGAAPYILICSNNFDSNRKVTNIYERNLKDFYTRLILSIVKSISIYNIICMLNNMNSPQRSSETVEGY